MQRLDVCHRASLFVSIYYIYEEVRVDSRASTNSNTNMSYGASGSFHFNNTKVDP